MFRVGCIYILYILHIYLGFELLYPPFPSYTTAVSIDLFTFFYCQEVN